MLSKARRWMFCWLCVLCGSLAVSGASAANLVLSDVPSVNLSAHVSVMRHSGDPLTLDDALEHYRQGKFQALAPGQSTNFGITRDEIWLQLDFTTADISPRWLLEVAHPSLDVLDVYLAGPDGRFRHQRTGDLIAFNQRPVAHRNLMVEWQLAPETDYQLFVRARSQGTLSIPLTLWQPDAIWAHDQGSYVLLSLYYGLLLGLMLYNLFLFFALRDPLYLAYVAFVGLLGLGQAGLAGFTGQFIWPDNALLTHLSPTAGVSAAGIFGCVFVQRFLGLTPRSLCLHWLMPGLGVIFVLIFLCSLFWSYYLAALAVNLAALIFALSALLLGTVSFYQGRPGARFFVLAWVSLLIGMIILALHNLGVLPSNLLTTNAMLLGSGLEMVLLSLALGDRINAI
ncbi:MAG: hypothetical protein EA348_04525, partial [Pseudomonadaceae bacterium]